MGLMELELARMEHRLRVAEAEQRSHRLSALRDRKLSTEASQQAGPEPAKTDWPLITLRLGPFQLALFRTVRLPLGRPAGRLDGAA